MRFHQIAAALVAAGTGAMFAIIVHPWASLLGLVAGAAYFAFATERFRRRKRIAAEPMPASQRKILTEHVAYYRRLKGEAQTRFENDVRFFLAEQTITGAGNVEVSKQARILIAASAAMLTFGMPDFEWPLVRDIVVYPRAFDESYEDGGRIAGMVHLRGPILFSQADLKHGFQRSRDGHNVGIHEMAHVIDMLDGSADGIPGDLPWVSSAPWVKVLGNRLSRVRKKRYRHILRDYAGTNEAEFFSVAVEAFFEKPHELRKRDEELFEMLVGYFNQDPSRPGALPTDAANNAANER